MMCRHAGTLSAKRIRDEILVYAIALQDPKLIYSTSVTQSIEYIQMYTDQKELKMCINPQQRRAIFEEIVEALEGLGRLNSFSKNLDAFDDIFRKVNQAHHREYDQEAGQRAQCIFLFPFSAQSAHWEGSIEILKSTSHYTVFDRYGRFSIYRRSGGEFGSIVLTNSPDEAIAKLENVSAVNFLDSMNKYKNMITRLIEEKNELSLDIAVLHERTEIMNRRLNMTKFQHFAEKIRKMKFWSKK